MGCKKIFLSLCKNNSISDVQFVFACRAGKWDLITSSHLRHVSRRMLMPTDVSEAVHFDTWGHMLIPNMNGSTICNQDSLSSCLLEQEKWCPARPLSRSCCPKRIGSLLDPAEAAGMGVAGLACVKRVLINSQACKGGQGSAKRLTFSKCPCTPGQY